MSEQMDNGQFQGFTLERTPRGLFTEIAKSRGITNFYGMKMSRRPSTFAELKELVITEGSGCFESIAEIVDSIGANENPDTIVKQLPYDEEEGEIAFILPPAEETAK